MGEIALSGSCLCGSVAYELTGDARRFYHCHCERCRKASGSGHASNIILRLDAGEDLTRSYKVPEAERFTAVFCRICGSPMPRVYDGGITVVPAGSLDHDPGIEPQARIFSGSRAQWSCSGDALPCHDTYPERS